MVGTMNSNTASNSSDIFGGAFTARPVYSDDNQYVYVQLRPGLELVRKCLNTLKAAAEKNPSASYSLMGVANESHACLLTIAVDLGPRTSIASAKPEDQAVQGFNFISSIYASLFDFLPQYVPQPDEAARATAIALVDSMIPVIEPLTAPVTLPDADRLAG